LAALGNPIAYHNAIAVNYAAALGKYVPGKVASVAGVLYLFGRQNIRPPVAAAVVFLNMGLAVLVGLMIAAPLMLWGAIGAEVPLAWFWCVLLLAAGVVGLHPRVFFGIGNYLLRKTGREPIDRRLTLKHLVLPLCLIVVSRAFAGLILWLVARSMSPVGIGELPFFISASAAADTLGFLAAFAPAGIGVTEGVFLLVLGPVIGPGVSAIAAVLLRLLRAIMDIVLAAIGFIILRRLQRKGIDIG